MGLKLHGEIILVFYSFLEKIRILYFKLLKRLHRVKCFIFHGAQETKQINRSICFQDLKKPQYRAIVKEMHALVKKLEAHGFQNGVDGDFELKDDKKKWSFSHLILNTNAENEMKVIDVGGRHTILSLLFAERGCIAYVVDSGEKKYFRKFAKVIRHLKLDKRVNLISEDFLQTERFNPNSIDVIVSDSVLEHFPDDQDIKAMQKMAALLKKGGLVGTVVDYEPWAKNTPRITDRNPYSISTTFKRLIEPSGLTLIGNQKFIDCGTTRLAFFLRKEFG